MEKKYNTEDFGHSEGVTSIIEAIHQRAYNNARAEITDENLLLLFLKSWWSTQYNRPLKDPILASYTLEELLYEYYDKTERKKAEIDKEKSDSDKIEEYKEKQALDWAERMEQAELLEEQKNNKDGDLPVSDDDHQWMEDQMKQNKELYGENFGEDIDESFNFDE